MTLNADVIQADFGGRFLSLLVPKWPRTDVLGQENQLKVFKHKAYSVYCKMNGIMMSY